MVRFLACITAVLFLVSASPRATGQVGETAQIQGTVQDSTGAVVPGATVVATAIETNQTRTAVTNDTGGYAFPSLPIGEYTVRVEHPGFKTAVRRGLTLSVQDVAVVDVILQLGEVTERVEVTAAAPLLETSRATQGQVIDSERIRELPLNGRDYVQLALLSEGAIEPVGGRFGGFSASGQRTSQNNFMLNGVDNNDLEIAAQGRQAEVVKPIVDAIEEFRVETNSYSAEFGKAAGGILNLKVKSGTNQFHGALWHFFRNDNLDARNFFNTEDQPQAPFVRNQWGGALGGPVIKDKLFFFHAQEYQRRRESDTLISTLPTPRMRQGDFSEISEQIFDPATFDPESGSRQPFVNNQIPQARLDRIATELIPLVPDPQTEALTRNFQFPSPRGFNEFKTDNRADWIPAASDNFAFAFSHSDRDLLPDPAFPGELGGGQVFTFHGTVLSAHWTHVFSPNVITVTRGAWNRRYTNRSSPLDRNLASELGLEGVNQALDAAPQFNITGFRNLGGPLFTPNLIQSQNRQVKNDTSIIRGNHQIKFGADIQRLQSFLTNPQVGAGLFSFTGAFTRNPDGNIGGNGFSDFLLGFPQSAQTATEVFMNLRSWHQSGYVQDTWKATPRLTLNMGLRYELFLPWQDKQNGIANFEPDPLLAPRATLVVAQDGPRRIDRSLIATDTNNFAPRFGLAYRLGAGTVLRAAYGIFYGTFEGTGGGEFLETNLPFNIRPQLTTDSINPTLVLENGLPPVLTLENVQSPRLSNFERVFDFPYSQQWNLNIQKNFGADWLTQIGYFGSSSKHLVQSLDLNQPLPGPGNVNERRPFREVAVPGTDRIISPISGFQAHRFNGNANYHSLQAKLEKRFSGGFTILSSYIWSRTIGDTCGFSGSGNAAGCGEQNVRNLRLERGLDNQHRKHRFVASYIWQLPFGRGRRLGQNWGPVAEAVAGGWSVQGILTLTSGSPFSILVPGDPANVGGVAGTVNRPNLVGDPERPAGVDPVDQFFNTAAFEPNAPFTFGNLGRNTLTGPSLKNFDFGLFKDFLIREGMTAQFRFEAFNFLNRPQFAIPGNQVGTDPFGQISSTTQNNRKLQFALKLLF